MYTLIHSYNKNINFFSKTGKMLLRSTPTFAFSSLRFKTCPYLRYGAQVWYRNCAALAALQFFSCPVLHAFLWKAKRARCFHILLFSKTGNVLFSQAASRQVSSALGSLTSVFEMGTGGSSPPLSPDPTLVSSPYCCVAAPSIRCSHTQVCSAPFSFARLALRIRSCAYLYFLPFKSEQR